MKKREFSLLLEFRQAKFLFWEIPVPFVLLTIKTETFPKRLDEFYER